MQQLAASGMRMTKGSPLLRERSAAQRSEKVELGSTLRGSCFARYGRYGDNGSKRSSEERAVVASKPEGLIEEIEQGDATRAQS